MPYTIIEEQEAHVVLFDVGDTKPRKLQVVDPDDLQAILAKAPVTAYKFVIHTYLVHLVQEGNGEPVLMRSDEPIRKSKVMYLPKKCRPASLKDLADGGHIGLAAKLSRGEIEAFVTPMGLVEVNELGTSVLLSAITA